MKLDIEEIMRDFMENPDLYNGESVLIGENESAGISVFCEGVVDNGALYPEISVWADDDIVWDETVYSKKDFEALLTEIDTKFFTEKAAENTAALYASPDGYDDEDDDDEMDREAELKSAVRDFLNVVYQCDPFEGIPDEEDMIDEVEEELLLCLADFDDDIYRPTEVDMGDGKIKIVEYPYSTI